MAQKWMMATPGGSEQRLPGGEHCRRKQEGRSTAVLDVGVGTAARRRRHQLLPTRSRGAAPRGKGAEVAPKEDVGAGGQYATPSGPAARGRGTAAGRGRPGSEERRGGRQTPGPAVGLTGKAAARARTAAAAERSLGGRGHPAWEGLSGSPSPGADGEAPAPAIRRRGSRCPAGEGPCCIAGSAPLRLRRAQWRLPAPAAAPARAEGAGRARAGRRRTRPSAACRVSGPALGRAAAAASGPGGAPRSRPRRGPAPPAALAASEGRPGGRRPSRGDPAALLGTGAAASGREGSFPRGAAGSAGRTRAGRALPRASPAGSAAPAAPCPPRRALLGRAGTRGPAWRRDPPPPGAEASPSSLPLCRRAAAPRAPREDGRLRPPRCAALRRRGPERSAPWGGAGVGKAGRNETKAGGLSPVPRGCAARRALRGSVSSPGGETPHRTAGCGRAVCVRRRPNGTWRFGVGAAGGTRRDAPRTEPGRVGRSPRSAAFCCGTELGSSLLLRASRACVSLCVFVCRQMFK